MEQFECAERYLHRLRNVYAGLHHAHAHAAYYEDDAISFFIHRHHLRDWITHLYQVGEMSRDADVFIDAHHELKVCQDLCNGSKHCRLKRTHSGRQPHIAFKSCRVTSYTPESGRPTTFRAKYQIIADDKIYDALELAEKRFQLLSSYRARLASRVDHAT